MPKENTTLIKQYELMVTSANQVTMWRQTTNGFYVTINTALLTLTTYFYGTSPSIERIISPLIGIALSLLWRESIQYFGKLNEAKFNVIHAIEKQLPVEMFKLEWEYYKNGNCATATQIEKNIPSMFIIVYAIVFLLSLLQ